MPRSDGITQCGGATLSGALASSHAIRGHSPSVACTSIVLPSRITPSVTSRPGGLPLMSRSSQRSSEVWSSSNCTSTSPIRRPAFAAGPSGAIQATIAPNCGMPIACAMSGVTSWIFSPSQPGRTQPYFLSCSITNSAW